MNVCEIVESKYKNDMQYVTRMVHKNVFACSFATSSIQGLFSPRASHLGTLNEGLALYSPKQSSAFKLPESLVKGPRGFWAGRAVTQ